MSENNQALTLKQKSDSVASLLKSFEAQIQQALPRFLTAERMIRVALTAMGKNPLLLDCNHKSLISCLLTSAQLGLLPDGVLGEAYLIPFKNTKRQTVDCTFIVGYRGYIMLAQRSGLVQSISARAVFKGDVFEYEFGLEEKLRHIPSGNKNPNEITHFYAVVKLKNGGVQWVVMLREEVDAVRDNSANYKFAKNKAETIWHNYYEEMGCKTVTRKLMKYVPLSSEINMAVGIDEQSDLGIQNTKVTLLQTDDVPDAMIDEVYDDIAYEQEEQKELNASNNVANLQSRSSDAMKSAMEKLEEFKQKKEARNEQ